ncbi:MAG: flagellar protein FliS [Planctomycetia bacterium]|nr:flagellar protein FliS [Planctomycetia bacterium]
MSHTAGNTYFENQVQTASPQKLHWMLVDAALRDARRAEESLLKNSPIQASADLAHAEAIIAEILCAMRRDLAPELVDKCQAIYGFILRSLSDAHLKDDLGALQGAIRVLAVEHETWRMAVENAAAKKPSSAPAPHLAFDSSAVSSGFSFEA